MRKTIETVMCDICGKNDKEAQRLKIPVIYNAVEGKSYVCMNELDLCEECLMKATNVYGGAANTHNMYELRLQKERKHERDSF